MGRFATSWDLTKTSFRVASHDKELLLLPILSFLASAVSLILVVGAAWQSGVLPLTDANGGARPAGLALAALLYLVLAFIQTYFAAAVVAGATERLNGGNPTLSSALRAPAKRIGRILAWSAVVATVNILLQLLRERGGAAGRWVAGLGNLAWSLATYFVVPVLLFEDVPVTGSLHRSSSLFRKTWGEQIIGNGVVGLVFGVALVVLFLIGMIVLQPMIVAKQWMAALPIVAVLVMAGAAILALAAVVQGIYKAALYRFATTGQAGLGFTPEQLAASFRRRV